MVEKQNSLQHLAQNLEKIKSFQPSGFHPAPFEQYNEYGEEATQEEFYSSYPYKKKEMSGVFDKKSKTFVPQYQKPIIISDQLAGDTNKKPSKINISDQINQQNTQTFSQNNVKFTQTTTTTTSEATGMLPIDQIGNLQLPQLSGQGIQEIINNATKPGAEGAPKEENKQQQSSSQQNQFYGNNAAPQINQMNSYNINQFGNLNIGQISNNNFGNMPVFQNIGGF